MSTRGIGIYVNGSINDEINSPVININSDSQINSTGVGLYLAGSSIVNIDNASITGEESAISIKSGTLNIKSGTFYCSGKDNTPTPGNNNGANPSGATIQIESNSGYAGNIEINISGGSFTSKNSHVIYEYIGKGNTSLVNKINIAPSNVGTAVANMIVGIIAKIMLMRKLIWNVQRLKNQ